ncbi:hypothetical protein FVO59_03160 [Microbacterium esteraromaticum]|uniref:DUF4232 domain-containing protein n=1 Tax=Microbacterium esteraromaticum TaxID=57043 RepID=A0A7D8AEU6_9MICO|nr:hypothetical protein FVO59_03160 [Microbacterium esteraromaticum]
MLLIAVLVLAAVGGGVWLAIAQPWSASAPAADDRGVADPTPDADEPTATADESTTPSPDPSETPGIVACTDADVSVAAVTDADAYPAGVLPQLSISLTNTSGQDCTMNVGSSTQTFTVTSGADVWWRSTDCQSESSDLIVTLEAGKSVTSAAPVVWDRTRSSAETCDEKNRPRAPGGDASYHIAVSIGGFASEKAKQIILR